MVYRRALEVLSDGEVEFVAIGGVAASAQGSAAVTFDLDICYSRTATNLKRLVSALAPFSPRPRDFPETLPFVWDEVTLRNSTVLTLQTTIGKIDLLAEVAGVGGWDEVKAQSREIDVFGCRVLVLNLPALIQSKKAAGRPKDFAAIPELEALLEAIED